MAKTRLQELIEEYGYTIYSFEEIGFSKDVISKLNRDKSHFDEDKINKLCDFFAVTSDYFLKRSNDGIIVYSYKLNRNFMISAEKLEYYKAHEKISYAVNSSGEKVRCISIDSLDDIETIESNPQLIKLKNEIF